MGPLKDILSMIPALGKRLKEIDFSDEELDQIEAIISSMTREERRRPAILDDSRRERIARGSGRTVAEVGLLMEQFELMAKMIRETGV